MIINLPFKRKRLREHTPSVIPSKGQQWRDNVMDDITHGQWSKKYRDSNEDDNNTDHSQAKDILDPYNIQLSFRKMADKLSRRL